MPKSLLGLDERPEFAYKNRKNLTYERFWTFFEGFPSISVVSLSNDRALVEAGYWVNHLHAGSLNHTQYKLPRSLSCLGDRLFFFSEFKFLTTKTLSSLSRTKEYHIALLKFRVIQSRLSFAIWDIGGLCVLVVKKRIRNREDAKMKPRQRVNSLTIF